MLASLAIDLFFLPYKMVVLRLTGVQYRSSFFALQDLSTDKELALHPRKSCLYRYQVYFQLTKYGAL